MKFFAYCFVAFLLASLGSCQKTHAVTPVDNQIAMSYATMSISQTIVASAAMRTGGNFSLSVQAVDGGGRGPPNFPNDIANLTITFYNYSNGVIGTATSNNTTGWGWNTYTVNSTNCGGASCSQLAYFVISFTGNDGGYWAGNVGTNFKDPKLTFTPTGQTIASTVNIIYNPEFGVNGTYTTTSGPNGWSQSTGSWGGNTHPQLLNLSGTLNAAGGGLIAGANTGSGRAGGYAQITTSIANQNIAGNNSSTVWLYQGNMSADQWYNLTIYIRAGWTWSCSNCAVTSGTVTNGVNNSGIYQITIVDGSGNAVTPDSGRVYTFYPPGYVPAVTVTGTSNSTIATTSVSGSTTSYYSQPVTITYYSDGSQTTANNGAATLLNTNTVGSSAAITAQEQTRVTAFNNRTITNNTIYIDQVGSNNTLNVTQSGRANELKGIGQQAVQIQGSSNNITVRQGDQDTSGKNSIEMRVVGGSNTLNLNQSVTTTGNSTNSSNNHYQNVDVNGYYNQLTTQQTNTGGIGGQYMETSINGNTNNIIAKQTDNGNKTMFNYVTGSNNTVTATQSGTGQHYLENALNGNGNTVTAVQSGTTANRASITINNSGGPGSVDLQQTGGANYSITTTCVTAGGCGTITVRQ